MTLSQQDFTMLSTLLSKISLETTKTNILLKSILEEILKKC